MTSSGNHFRGERKIALTPSGRHRGAGSVRAGRAPRTSLRTTRNVRDRRHILTDLERAYREAFERAEREEDDEAMARLDFEFQRDQLLFEVALDLRDSFTLPAGEEDEEGRSLLDHAKALRDLSRGKLP